MRSLVLLTALALATPAHAEAHYEYRKLGVGLLIAGAALVVVGGVFVGLAANANSGVLDNHQYHPDLAAQRDGFQATDTVMFVAGGGAIASGLVFTLDGTRR